MALQTPSLALVWQLNAVRVDDVRADAAAVTAEAERVQADLAHRKLVVHDEDAGPQTGDRAGRAGLERARGCW